MPEDEGMEQVASETGGDVSDGQVGEDYVASPAGAEAWDATEAAKDVNEDDALEEDDSTQPMFAYDPGDGKEVQLSGDDLIERLSEYEKLKADQAKWEQERAELVAKSEKPEAAPEPVPLTAAQAEFFEKAGLPAPYEVNWDQVGTDLVDMLEGNYLAPGSESPVGSEALGSALRNLMANVVYETLPKLFPHYQQETQNVEEQKNAVFQEFPGLKEALESKEIEKFQSANPLYSRATKLEAFLAMQAKQQKQELETLRQQIEGAKTEGKKAGQQETIKNLRAKGNIKLLTGKGGRPTPAAPAGGNKANDWVAALHELRGQ